MLNVLLSGGLGNQMFQYAFALYLEKISGKKVALNTRLLEARIEGTTPRKFELNNFKLQADLVDTDVLVGKNRILNILIRKGLIPGYSFEKDCFQRKRYFWGHWHDLKYFQDKRSLLEAFELKSPSDKYYFYLEKIIKSESISVHIRRGDYVTNPKAAKHHGVMPIEYFRKAISELKNLFPSGQIYLFSDDPKWTQENLDGEIVLLNTTSAEELILMAKCSHNIISNSSFSWWAAYLNENSKKNVIYPRVWNLKSASPPIFPENWRSL